VNGGYTQQDVIALAHILTGWGLPRGRDQQPRNSEPQLGEFGLFGPMRRRRFNGGEARRMPPDPSFFYFDADRHDFGDKLFLGHEIRGGGIQEGEQALDILARHPSTARHLSYQLAQYFVSDNPPDTLVQRMTQRYSQTDGNIREVLTTIFTSPEFWNRRSYAAKFKSPYEYVVSCVRATDVQVSNYRPLYGTMQLLGMPLYGCQTPNGYDNTRDAWLNPDAMMTRLSFATALGAGNLPLDRPPFEEDEEPKERAAVPRKAGANANTRIEYNPNRPNRMTPPDANRLTRSLGGTLSESTGAAIEAAPMQLRAALVLGSPEFMMR